MKKSFANGNMPTTGPCRAMVPLHLRNQQEYALIAVEQYSFWTEQA